MMTTTSDTSIPPERAKALRKKIAIRLAGCYIAFFFGVISLAVASPLRAIETISLIAIIALLPALALGQEVHRRIANIFTQETEDFLQTNRTPVNDIIQHDPGILRMTLFFPTVAQCGDKNLRNNIYVSIIFGYLAAWLIIIGAAVTANHFLDARAPERVTVTILDKYTSHRKNGGLNYNIRFESPAPALFPFTGTYNEKLSVSRDVYSRIIVGKSTATLDIHRGALSLPWYSRPQNIFDNLAPAGATPQTKRP